MSKTLSELIESFSGVSVAVLGEAMVDSYLEGSSDRLAQEAPVPVVRISKRTDAPGGAANAAVNVRALGGRTTLLSVVGEDRESEILTGALKAAGVSVDGLIVDPARRTLAKQRVVSNSQMLVRFDQGSTDALERDVESSLIDRLASVFGACDAVVVSDYGYGILTSRVIDALTSLQASSPRLVVVDAKDLARYRAVGVTAVKPNYDQAMGLLGSRSATVGLRAEAITAEGERLLEVTGAHIVAVTLDQDGALVFERGAPPYRTYARPSRDTRAAGAGDTFIAALTLALAAGAHTPAAVELASAAAAIVVTKEGTATCSDRDLSEHLTAQGKYISDVGRLASRVEFYRSQGRRVAFTNGCFDILHRGHITYLNRAKALADILIVGLNSDEGVARLKGPGRPINALEDRIEVVAALSGVDHIVTFSEDTPVELIRKIRPDVFIKGGDYTIDMLPEARVVEELGGEVHILPYVENRSTTGIIERIRNAASEQRHAAVRKA